MSEYGVTDKGFVLKRLDVILEEVHADLTAGFGVDTRLLGTSFLKTLIMTFTGQIADLWETAQDSYYAKFPATADGINLDNAVQYGGIRRAPNQRTCYPLHCPGNDGTHVRYGVIVATNTMPEIRLYSAQEFQISRESFNSVDVVVAAVQTGVYTVGINGESYSYSNDGGNEKAIIAGLETALKASKAYTVQVIAEESGDVLRIEDTVKARSSMLVLSDNLTTASVTTIANFFTQDYGKITLPYGIICKMVNNISGVKGVTNLLEPIYGRLAETDIELRQSYIAKSALRSNTMIDSIVAELLNNVVNVESATGYENDTENVNARGMPPHSIEIIVEGGDASEIASAILRRKAGGIQTYGNVVVDVPGSYGDSIPVRFNRPEYLYAWLKIVLHGDESRLPINYARLTVQSVLEDGSRLSAGESLLTQLLNDGIYSRVAGVSYIDIYTAYSIDTSYVPGESDYQLKNIPATSRQKVLMDEKRIEVIFHADS